MGPLEKGMATLSSILAWRIPWTEPWQATVHRVTKNQSLSRVNGTHNRSNDNGVDSNKMRLHHSWEQ